MDIDKSKLINNRNKEVMLLYPNGNVDFQQSCPDDGADELDRELDEIVRSAYHSVNQDYLRQQAINALVASGKNREDAEAWLNQCEIGVK